MKSNPVFQYVHPKNHSFLFYKILFLGLNCRLKIVVQVETLMTVQIRPTGWERWECLRRRGTNGKRMTDFDSLQQANLFRWASCWVIFWLVYESYVDYCILASEPFQVSINLCWYMSHVLVDLWVICWLPHRSKRTFSGEHLPLLIHESYVGWCMSRLLITASKQANLFRWVSASVDAWVACWLMFVSCFHYRILVSEPFQMSIRLCWCMSHVFIIVSYQKQPKLISGRSFW